MSFLGRLQFEICLGLVSPNWMHFLSLQCHFCLIYWAKKQDIIALMTFYLFKSLLNNWVSSLRLRGLRNTRWKTLCVHTKLVTNYRYDTKNGTRRDSRRDSISRFSTLIPQSRFHNFNPAIIWNFRCQEDFKVVSS